MSQEIDDEEAIAAEPSSAGATATGAEPKDESAETHPTYNWFGEEENQESLKNKGYKFGQNENGNPVLTTPSGSEITVNKDGTYSGSTIGFDEIGKQGTPEYDQNVKKMAQELQDIAKAHEDGPNSKEPLDLNVNLNGDENLSDEQKANNQQFIKDVKAEMSKNLTPEQRENVTFNKEKIVAPAQDKTASLTATGQTPSATPAQSTTAAPAVAAPAAAAPTTPAKSTTAAPAASTPAAAEPTAQSRSQAQQKLVAKAKGSLSKAYESRTEDQKDDKHTHIYNSSVIGITGKTNKNAAETAADHLVAVAQAHHDLGATNPLNLVANPKQTRMGPLGPERGPMPDGPEKEKFLADVRKHIDEKLPPNQRHNVSVNGEPLAPQGNYKPVAAIAPDVSSRDVKKAKASMDKAYEGRAEGTENATLTHDFPSTFSASSATSRKNAVEETGNHFIAMAKAHQESGRTNTLNLVADPMQRKSDVQLDPQTLGVADLAVAAVDAAKRKPLSDDEKAKFDADVKKYVDDRLSPDEKKNVSINGQPLATPPQTEMGATASAAEAESAEEEHPTYTHLAKAENQKDINKTLEGSGYKFATDEEGKVNFHGPDDAKISVNKDGSYSGTTIPLEEIKPDHPQYQKSIDKMGQDLKAIVKAHENGPNAGEPLNLSMGLSKEEMEANPKFVEDVQKYLDKNLTEEQKKNITLDDKEIKAPAQDKTASLTATGQTPSATSAQSTTPTPAQSTTPTPSPQSGGSAKEAEETMTCQGYYDNKDRFSHVHIPSGPQAGWYENKAEVGDANMQKINGKPAWLDDKVETGELHKMEVEYPKNQREESLTNLSATASHTNLKRMEGMTPAAPGQEAAQLNIQTNISGINANPNELTTRANKDISADLQNNESNSRFGNLHTQISNDATLRESIAKEGAQSKNGGFSNLTRNKDASGQEHATLRNTDNGQHIDIKQDGSMKGSLTPPSKAHSNEATAEHHANIFKGMMGAMAAMGGDNPINAVFSLMQGGNQLGANHPVAKMVMDMLKEHLDKNPALKDMTSNVSLNGQNVHHNKDAKRPEKKVRFANDHKGHDKENAHHTPTKTAHAAKPTPGHGSHGSKKPGDETHPDVHQSLKPKGPKGKSGGGPA
ncbi:MAG TPA: hypothetical protein VGV92_08815 [Gammaproteobacteria bacterium]|nr:hypothetical protein [Gammaproteobacteria bacterium]